MEKTGFLQSIGITSHTSGYTVEVTHILETDEVDPYSRGKGAEEFKCVTVHESYACNNASDVFDILKQYMLLDFKAQQEYFADCPQFGS